jgi:basic membrane lipoprotein Med (substrate-binding protein (PBP1-ABC) superfamily)
MQKRNILVFIILLLIIVLIVTTIVFDSILKNKPKHNEYKFIKIAMVLPDEINDNSFSQKVYEALKIIEQKYNVNINYKSSVSENIAYDIFKDFAIQGYDIIIGHGEEYYTALNKAASKYKDTKFLMVGSKKSPNRNFIVVGFDSYEIGYLAGYIAAVKTKTKKIGYICGSKPNNTQYVFSGFKTASQNYDTNIIVTAEWIGSWTDSDKTLEAVKKLINKKYDVIYILSDAGGDSSYIYADKHNVFTIGSITDKFYLGPNTVITSFIRDYTKLYLKAVDLFVHGWWTGDFYKMGFEDRAVDTSEFRHLTEKQLKQINKCKEKIISKDIIYNYEK